MRSHLVLTAALALTGCRAVGPNYQPPAAPPAGDLRAPPASAATNVATHPSGLSWWAGWASPELAQLLEEVDRGNRQLSASAARLEEARARLGLARAEGSVSLQLNASARLAGESAERALPLPNGRTTYRDRGDTYRVPFEASWEVDLWGRVRRSREAAEAAFGGQEAEIQALHLSLTAEAATTYLTRTGLLREQAVLDRTLALRRTQLELLSSRQRSGLGTSVDVERAGTDLALAEVERKELERRIQLLDTALALLAGRTGTWPRAADAAPLTVPRPADLPSTLLLRRPDVRSAERQLASRTAEIGVARAAAFPQVRLTGAAGFEGSDLGPLLEHPAQFWQFGPAITLPLLDGGRNRRNLEAAQARAGAAHEDYQQRVLVAFRETADALRDLDAYRAEEELQAVALRSAQSTEALAQRRFDSGLSAYFEVTDAQRLVLGAERSLEQVRTQRQVAEIRLVRSLGGSWQ